MRTAQYAIALAIIALFGGIGSCLRFLMTGWTQSMCSGVFPVGTLVVNVIGCLGIGVVGAFLSSPQLTSEYWRYAVIFGLLGGFTTFSSFAWETLSLANDGQFARALANVALSNILGLLAAWIGFRAGRALAGT